MEFLGSDSFFWGPKNGGFHGGTQKWLVYKGKSESKKDDNWAYPYVSGNHHVAGDFMLGRDEIAVGSPARKTLDRRSEGLHFLRLGSSQGVKVSTEESKVFGLLLPVILLKLLLK